MGLFGYFARKKEEQLRKTAELLEWQNAVCADKSTTLYMTEGQLASTTIQIVSNDIRIFDDCANIINSTEKPSVFFPRLALAEETIRHLVEIEAYIKKVGQIQMNTLPSDLYQKFQGGKDAYITEFLYRYYNSVRAKADRLKTERGKQNQFQKFFESLEPYFDQISERNMFHIEALRHQEI